MKKVIEKQVIDISHPIQTSPACSFAAVDSVPKLSFEEGDSHGVTFITSRVDNLHSNTCTHIDFPGHLASLGRKFPKSIGMYPIERFIGQVFIADFSEKLKPLAAYFDKEGKLSASIRDETSVMAFLKATSELTISKADLTKLFKTYDVAVSSLKGLILYTGLGNRWQNKKFESWEYIYFYSPFLTDDACDFLIENKLSFVGIDAFQLENSIINFNGYELPLILHEAARKHVAEHLKQIELFSNHFALLGKDILIYENLRIPAEIKNHMVEFSGVPLNMRLEGMNDNALVRPYVSVVK
jgi:kynurenine formamidase